MGEARQIHSDSDTLVGGGGEKDVIEGTEILGVGVGRREKCDKTSSESRLLGR